MLFNSRSLATGMSSHPRFRRILPILSMSRLLPRRRLNPRFTVTFSPTLKIPHFNISHIAGGSNGYEFSPN